MIKQKINYFLVIAMYFITTVAVFAQDEFEEDEGPEGPPPAPIDKFVLILAIVGIAFAWHTFKKSRLANTETKQSNIQA